MPAYIDQSVEDFQKVVNIGNLPIDVTTKQVNDLFGRFGVIVNVYFRRRTSKDSNVLLPNPNAFLTFQKQESIDKIMAERPHIMNDIELSVNRCLPITRRYPYERYTVTNKMLVRVPKENHEEILPNDQMIIDYLKPAGGQIIRFEKWEEKTVFVEFDDYDPVDVCCLSRPHSIANQIIEVEKCSDEEQARLRAQFRQK
jgi:RNA recognition motif-containing protein